MKQFLFFKAIVVFFFFVGCSDDDLNIPNNDLEDPNAVNEEIIDDNFSSNFGVEIERDFLGLVQDQNGQPIENVLVSVGGKNTTTDDNGVFIIREASVNKRFAYISTEASGYIHGSRSLVPVEGENRVTIVLLEENPVETVASGNASTVTLANGASVSFNGSYQNDIGESYEGDVSIILHYLDPLEEQTQYSMPGMLYAQDSNNQERMLQTFGMLAVELRGEGGQELNLLEGTTAEIKVPLNPMISNPPSVIPLWYFNEDKGYWIEEGEAVLENGYYVGDVSHFSFWNCDIPAEAVTLCVNLVGENGQPFGNTQVKVSSATYGSRSGVTNNLGNVCGLIPRGESLQIDIYGSGDCNDIIVYSGIIGPYTEDTEIVIVVELVSPIIVEEIVGSFNDCNGNPVTNGYVSVLLQDTSYLSLIDQGSIEMSVLNCSQIESFQVYGVDYESQQSSGFISYSFTNPTTDLGTIFACQDSIEYIIYSIDGEQENVLLSEVTTEYLEINPITGMPSIYISVDDANTGDVFLMIGSLYDSITGIYDDLDENDLSDTGFLFGVLGNALDVDIIYNFSEFEEIGGYIDISFQGTFIDETGEVRSLEGELHVLRDN